MSQEAPLVRKNARGSVTWSTAEVDGVVSEMINPMWISAETLENITKQIGKTKDNCIDGYLPYHEVWTDLRYYRRKWLWKNNVDASDCRTGKPQHRQAIVWWKEQSVCKLFLSPSLVRHRLSKSR